VWCGVCTVGAAAAVSATTDGPKSDPVAVAAAAARPRRVSTRLHGTGCGVRRGRRRQPLALGALALRHSECHITKTSTLKLRCAHSVHAAGEFAYSYCKPKLLSQNEVGSGVDKPQTRDAP